MLAKFVALGALLLAQSASATMVFVKNQCPHQIDLYDNEKVIPIPSASNHDVGLPDMYKNMLRHGRSPQATLFEINVNKTDHRTWYDISVIATGNDGIHGPEHCMSVAECKSKTRGFGFNVAMKVTPRSNVNGRNCVPLTCLDENCTDGYLFPDDKKTHDCPFGTDFDLVFCPNATPAPTTPAPTTPAPTTPTPTNATEDRSIDGLLESGSGTTLETPVPTTEPVVTETATPVGTTAAPAVEANTQSGADTGSGIAGTLVVVLGALAAVAGVAMIVVIRRKKAALDAMEDKNSMALTTPVEVL